jgi:hypothetical protein
MTSAGLLFGSLELNGLVLTPDPEATYRATLQTLLRGLAPQA